jgi:protein gp37
MKRSGIIWTDYSGGNLNFVRRGQDDCECSPGCDHCYARRIGERFGNLPEATTVYPEKLARLSAQKFPTIDGRKPRAFVCDTGDLFHPNVSDDFIMDAFDVMSKRTDVIWQVLTKRTMRMEHIAFMFSTVRGVTPNIWLGVTAENQAMADERIPLLLQTPAAVRFVSVEPMLEPLNIMPWVPLPEKPDYRCARGALKWAGLPSLDWVICGGESGPAARPLHPDWVRSLRDQCASAGVPFLFKQWGPRDAGRLLDGREWLEFPEAER